MRPEGVVFPAVFLDDYAGFGEGPELLTVEAFVTESAMEALYIADLPWTARIDVDCLDLVLREPRLDGFGDELAAVVASKIRWCSMLLDGPSHPFKNISTLECPVSSKHMALSGVLIEDR